MITGFILAGGKSSRMGEDKALLSLGSKSLTHIVAERLRVFVDQLFVVANARNHRSLEGLPVNGVILDDRPDGGPLVGVYTGLLNSGTDLNIFVPCDMPLFEQAVGQVLIDCCRRGAKAAAAELPGEGIQPFPLACCKESQATVEELLRSARASVRDLLKATGSHIERIEDPALWASFTNVNTKEDLTRIASHLQSSVRGTDV